MDWPTTITALRDFLQNPPATIDGPDLPNFWYQTDIEMLLTRPAEFEEGAWTPRHLRGAVLDHLYRNFGEDGPIALLRHTGVQAWGRELPSPILFRVVRHEYGLKVEITLFGIADIFRDVVISALALAGQEGIRITERGALRASMPARDLRWRHVGRVTVPSFPTDIWLRPLTPLRTGNAVRSPSPGAILMNGLIERQVALARWMGADLVLSDMSVFERARAVQFNEVTSRPEGGFSLHSRAEPGAKRHRYGHMSTFSLNNITEDVWPYLWLGQMSGAGSDLVLGFGRYEIG